MVRSHPTHNRTRLWQLTTCMGFGFGITRQFYSTLQEWFSVIARWHRVRPLTTTAALGSSQVNVSWRLSYRRTRWMLWPGACHCLLYLESSFTVPNINQAPPADPRSPTPVPPSPTHQSLELYHYGLRRLGLQETSRCDGPALSWPQLHPRWAHPVHLISRLVWVAWFVFVETFCQYQFLPSG
jgi:hypothetical protein